MINKIYMDRFDENVYIYSITFIKNAISNKLFVFTYFLEANQNSLYDDSEYFIHRK